MDIVTPDEDRSPDDDDQDFAASNGQELHLSAPRCTDRLLKPKKWLDFITFKVTHEPQGEDLLSVKEALTGSHREE